MFKVFYYNFNKNNIEIYENFFIYFDRKKLNGFLRILIEIGKIIIFFLVINKKVGF